MKLKIYKQTKRILKLILLLALGGLVYSFSFTTYENIKVNKVIHDFKKRAITTQVETIELVDPYTDESYIRKLWPVPRETSFERDGLNVFSNAEKTNLGQKGDIFTTRQSPFPTIPVFHQFMSYYYGGHAAIYDGSGFLEATGYPDDISEFLKIVFNKGNSSDHGLSTVADKRSTPYWTRRNSGEYYYDNYYRSKYIGLRIKDADNEMIDAFVDSAQQKIDKKSLYNFLFFLDMKYKYYCTDLVSRAYEEAYYRTENNDLEYHSKGYAKKLNDDGFITSVNDLVLSKDSYMHFYVEITKEHGVVVENFYYLEDI